MDIKENHIIMNSYKEYLMLQKVCADIRREVISLNIIFTDASYSQNSSSAL
jgi:hypothetical protein